jgi:hypothetical protein
MSSNTFSEHIDEVNHLFKNMGLDGGARKKAEESDSESSDASSVDDRKVISVSEIDITQKRDDFTFESTTKKSPAINLKFRGDEVKVAAVVKALLRYVNKRLRMQSVKEVTLVSGKKKDTFKGDNLGDMLKLNGTLAYDKVDIKMD